jgi:hypothetical protein
MQDSRDIRLLSGGSLKRRFPANALSSKAVENINDIVDTEQSEAAWRVVTIHELVGHLLDLLNTPFSRILMLMMRFTLKVIKSLQ